MTRYATPRRCAEGHRFYRMANSGAGGRQSVEQWGVQVAVVVAHREARNGYSFLGKWPHRQTRKQRPIL